MYFDPYFKNRDEIESKFFVEFWSGCCTKLCSKIRQSDRLPNNFRKKFDAEIDSFENVIEKSIEQNQLDIKLSGFYLIQYMAQFFSINKLDLKQLILSPTNNDVFMKNVFINFWRILTKPFVQKRNKRKRELDFFRKGLENNSRNCFFFFFEFCLLYDDILIFVYIYVFFFFFFFSL